MVKKVFVIAITLFIVGCGGSISSKKSEEDKFLPKRLKQENLININSSNNKYIAQNILENIFNEDETIVTNSNPLILKRLKKVDKKQFRYNLDDYTTNYCDEGSFDKYELDDSSYKFDFHHCKKSGTNIYLDGIIIVSMVDNQKIKFEFQNYKESSTKLLHYIRKGSIVKTTNNTNQILNIEVKNLYAYFRDNDKRSAYYNLNLIKNFYDYNREYIVDGYVYVDKYRGYTKIETIDSLIFDNPNINNASLIYGEILIGNKIDIIFNGDNISYIYDGIEEDYTVEEFI